MALIVLGRIDAGQTHPEFLIVPVDRDGIAIPDSGYDGCRFRRTGKPEGQDDNGSSERVNHRSDYGA